MGWLVPPGVLEGQGWPPKLAEQLQCVLPISWEPLTPRWESQAGGARQLFKVPEPVMPRARLHLPAPGPPLSSTGRCPVGWRDWQETFLGPSGPRCPQGPWQMPDPQPREGMGVAGRCTTCFPTAGVWDPPPRPPCGLGCVAERESGSHIARNCLRPPSGGVSIRLKSGDSSLWPAGWVRAGPGWETPALTPPSGPGPRSGHSSRKAVGSPWDLTVHPGQLRSGPRLTHR